MMKMNKVMNVVKGLVIAGGLLLVTTNTVDAAKYEVKQNDTLYALAKKNNITEEDIIKVNNLQSEKIVIGQILELEEFDEENPKHVGGFELAKTYTVVKGDTLSEISKATNVKLKDLKEINNLANDKIFVGQKLILEKVGEKLDYKIHIAQKGDTLSKIAKQYGVNVKDLLEMNSEKVAIGQEIYVPIEQKTLKATFTVVGFADTHTVEIKNKSNKEVFSLQVNSKQAKALKGKKTIKQITVKGNELIDFK